MNKMLLFVFTQKEKIIRLFFLLSLSGILVGMVLTNYLLSVSQFTLALFWLINMFTSKEARFRLSGFLRNKAALVLLSVYVFHLIGLLWTTNYGYAFHDLRIKLPLLILPFMLATLKPLSKDEAKGIFGIYLLALFVGVCLALYRFWWGTYTDIRQIIFFNSHIRFGLNVVMGIVVCGWFFKHVSLKIKPVFWGIGMFFVSFVITLQAMSAIVILIFLVLFFIARTGFLSHNSKIRWGAFSACILLFVFISGYVYRVYRDTLPKESKETLLLDKKTVNGNVYYHNVGSEKLENGYWLELYLCEPELRNEWQKRSTIPYSGETISGSGISATLMRYLTGKGLRKDSSGMARLSDEDIRNIEHGIPNHHYVENTPVSNRIRVTLWEISEWKCCNFISYNSVTQRFEFYRAALYTIKNNFWIGVGIGDVVDAQKEALKKINSSLPSEIISTYHIHNQFLSIFSGFGIFGFLWFLFALVYPAIKTRRFHSILYISFFIIVVMSMFPEDTLETQAGATFFAFFSSLLLFLVSDGSEANEKTGKIYEINAY